MTSYGHDNSKLARDYDRISAMQFETGKRLFERMGLQSGASVLDVGCGTGRLAEWIAAQVGPQGKVVGIDPLADRIALARDQVREVRFEIGYAEDLGAFADESFDGACLSAVFHWIPDKPKALAEIARVLRPGGRLGITTVPKDLHAASTMARVFASVFSLPAYRGRIRLDKFALAHQSVTVTETIAMLLAAGLSLVELHVMERSQRRVTEREMLDFMQASSFGNFFAAIPEDLHEAFRADFEHAIEAHGGQDGFSLRDYGMLLVARRPLKSPDG